MNIGEYLATKEGIRKLSLASQKVVMVIFEYPGSICTNKQIAERCFISENSVAVTLASLKKKQVVANYRSGRNSYWTICDPKIMNALMINDCRYLETIEK